MIFSSCQAKVSVWNNLEIWANSVQRFERIGRGSYADVYKGSAFGVDCAVKVYFSTASPEIMEEAAREIQIGASLDHPCTLRILGWIRKPLQTITELCRGDLKDFYLDKIDGMKYTELEALRLLRVSKVNCKTTQELFLIDQSS